MEALITSIGMALGWSLLHSLWQGAAIYLILFGSYLAIPRLKANTKHNLALAAQITVFFSFVYTFFNMLDYSPVVDTHTSLSIEGTTLFHVDYLQETQPVIQQYFMYIVPLYLLGILVQTILCINSYFHLKNLKRHANFTIPKPWQQRFYDSMLSLGITKDVKLLLSDIIYEPLAMGFFRPVIIFPVAYVNKLSLAEVEALLLHELTHIKRNDYLLNMIKIVLETILFFNPFIWLMSRHICTEREQACDDSVMQILPERTLYAKALLNVELLKQDVISPRMSLAATGVKSKYKLLHRIKRITQAKMETPYTNLKHQLVASLMVIFTLISVAWTKPNTNKQVNTKEPLITEVDTLSTELNMLSSELNNVITTLTTTDLSDDSLKNRVTDLIVLPDTNKIGQQICEKFESPEWKAHIAKI